MSVCDRATGNVERPINEPPSLNRTSPRFADKRLLTRTASERRFSVRPKDELAQTTQRYVFPNAL